MSRFGAKKGKKLPGAEFTWDTTDPSGEADTAPTPLFPKYTIPRARPISDREQVQVNLYRTLRERFHDGPYYSILGASSGSSGYTASSKANFDPFNGMPSYSGKYQKKKRLVPKLQGRPYVLKFFPRELWPTAQPNFRPDAALDGYIPQTLRSGVKRGFEEDDEDEETLKRRREGDEDGEGGEGEDLDADILDADEDQEEEIVDDDFEDDEDEMGGDYNAEQYFDGGEEDYGDDGFGDGGGGGGDEDTY